jgi:heptosyltransferase I
MMAGAFPVEPPRLERLLIVRLSAMGDIIHTLPAARLLREAFPQATLGWVVEERWSELLCAPGFAASGPRTAQRPLADRVHRVRTTMWRRSLTSFDTWRQMKSAIAELKGQRYDVAVDFQGAVRTALLSRWSGAPMVFGDHKPRENIARILYPQKVVTTGDHVVEQAVSIAEAIIGKRGAIPPVPFPVDPAAENRIDSTVAGMRGFAILNPGAGWGAKQWPADRYGRVARELAKSGVPSLINYGPGEEQLATAVEAASGGEARKVSCSISELIALTRRARLFIGGDTGPMHLAAALQVPVVGIFGPTNPARNGPFGTRSVVLRSSTSLTSHARHREPEKGLLEITPEAVITAAQQLMAIG